MIVAAIRFSTPVYRDLVHQWRESRLLMPVMLDCIYGTEVYVAGHTLDLADTTLNRRCKVSIDHDASTRAAAAALRQSLNAQTDPPPLLSSEEVQFGASSFLLDSRLTPGMMTRFDEWCATRPKARYRLHTAVELAGPPRPVTLVSPYPFCAFRSFYWDETQWLNIPHLSISLHGAMRNGVLLQLSASTSWWLHGLAADDTMPRAPNLLLLYETVLEFIAAAPAAVAGVDFRVAEARFTEHIDYIRNLFAPLGPTKVERSSAR